MGLPNICIQRIKRRVKRQRETEREREREREKERERKREKKENRVERSKIYKENRIKTKAWTDGGVMLFRCWELGGATSGTPKEDSSESAGLVATVASLPPAPSSNFRWPPTIPLQGFTKPSKVEGKLHHLSSAPSPLLFLLSSRVFDVNRLYFDSSGPLSFNIVTVEWC